jgi:hypothetical protein
VSFAVTAVNDAPTVDLNGATGGTSTTLTYSENGAPTAIAPTATVADVDSADFNGGSLTVAFTANGTTADQLTIQNQGAGAGQIGVSGSNVTFAGVTIGHSAAAPTTPGDQSKRCGNARGCRPEASVPNSSDNLSTLARTVHSRWLTATHRQWRGTLDCDRNDQRHGQQRRAGYIQPVIADRRSALSPQTDNTTLSLAVRSPRRSATCQSAAGHHADSNRRHQPCRHAAVTGSARQMWSAFPRHEHGKLLPAPPIRDHG